MPHCLDSNQFSVPRQPDPQNSPPKMISDHLQDSDRLFRQLFEHSTDAMLLFVDDGFIDCNQAAVGLFGYEHRSQLISVHPSQISPKFQPDGRRSADEEKNNRLFAQTFAQGFNRFEWVHQRADGQVFLAEVVLTVVEYRGQKIVHSVIRDISDREHSERVLTASRTFLANILSTIPDPVFVKDEQHRWVIVNDAFCQLIGQPLEALLGKSDYDFFSKAEADVFWEKDALVLETGEHNENEEGITDSKGKTHVILTQKTVFTDDEGQKFLVGSIQDITQLKQQQNDLEAAKQAAEVANQAKGLFLAHMSHELRTPLNIILGFTQLLQQDHRTPEAHRKTLSTINCSGEHLLGLINDVLEMSKIEAGRTVLNANDLDLHRLLASLQAMMQLKADRKNLALHLNLPLIYPATCRPTPESCAKF